MTTREMRLLLAAAGVLLGTVVTLGFVTAATQHCGTERWDVKTLTDLSATSWLQTPPIAATVEDLVKRPVPGPIQLHTPRYPDERQEYVVAADLVEAKLEDDRDLHVVMTGASRDWTMIAEFPDPRCVGNSVYRPMIAHARRVFVSRYGMPPSTHFVSLGYRMARLTGVLFFDVLHGQHGVAPNGVELHPVLNFE